MLTIENGCDFDDFVGLEYERSDVFRLTHTGSFFGKRDPKPFLRALADSGLEDVHVRFVGDFRPGDREFLESLDLGDRVELLDDVPRRRSLKLQRESDALLLLIPEAGGRGRGVLSGKVFEYIAAERPILAVVPPDGAAARLIGETGVGVVAAPDDVDAIRTALVDLHTRWRNGELDGPPALGRVARAVVARPPRRAARRAVAEPRVTLVTVCMPSYNYARFLRDAVDSVLGQSHAAFELLIIDNGSTDGSYEIAQEYEERDGRVRVLTHAGRENRGVNASARSRARIGSRRVLRPAAGRRCLSAGCARAPGRHSRRSNGSLVCLRRVANAGRGRDADRSSRRSFSGGHARLRPHGRPAASPAFP